MEALFGSVAVGKKSPKPSSTSPTQIPIFILDPRKSQNIAITLKSLEITHEELVKSLMESHDFLPEKLEKLANISPTKEEQTAILQFDGDTTKLADAESFLFHLLKAVPSAFTYLNALLFKANFYQEISNHNKSLQTLEAACTELRSRGLLVKLLEAILKSGNRLNTGKTQTLNLTAVLKLSAVKSIDGKTTLLNFVVNEVVKSEGKRSLVNRSNSEEYLKLGLSIVGRLSIVFSNVKKAATINYDKVSAMDLTSKAKNTRLLLSPCENKKAERLVKKMMEFLDSVEEEVKLVSEEEKKVMEFVKRTTEYYRTGTVEDENPFLLFVIVRDFLDMVDEVCVHIARNLKKTTMGISPERNVVKFPVLPSDFMSDKNDSGELDSDM